MDYVISNSRGEGLSASYLVRTAVAFGAGLLVTGCSANVSRFDYPAFNLNGDPGETGALPRSSDSGQPDASSAAPARSSNRGSDPRQYSRNGRRVEAAALPEIRDNSRPQRSTLPSATDQRTGDTAELARRPRPTPTFNSSANRVVARPVDYSPPEDNYATNSDGHITVRRGDTLYGLSRQHGVTVQALMRANGLTSTNLKPGQKLRLPEAAGSLAAPGVDSGQGRAEYGSGTRSAVAQPPAAGAASSDWQGSYTVVPGDSLYKIARHYNVKAADIQRENRISDPRRVRPGTVLRVPGTGSGSNRLAAAVNTDRRSDVAPQAPSSTEGLNLPKVINGSKRSTASNDAPVASKRVQVVNVSPPSASAPVETGSTTETQKLRWPAKGRILSSFGRRQDGTHNDGLNLAVPMGSDIHAAEGGVVAYAGSELKGYGNLILVRHDNGWVTAYAHADKLLVKRGDKVSRGQVIAKAGKSGEVEQPQLHFELRQGSKPVDPLPYLAKI